MTQPAVSQHWRTMGPKDWASVPSGSPHRAHNRLIQHMQYTYKHYAQWNEPSVTKPNPEYCKNCSSKSAYHCAQLSYTTQHGATLIIFSLNLQTSITAQILSVGGEGCIWLSSILTCKQASQLRYSLLEGRVVCIVAVLQYVEDSYIIVKSCSLSGSLLTLVLW